MSEYASASARFCFEPPHRSLQPRLAPVGQFTVEVVPALQHGERRVYRKVAFEIVVHERIPTRLRRPHLAGTGPGSRRSVRSPTMPPPPATLKFSCASAKSALILIGICFLTLRGSWRIAFCQGSLRYSVTPTSCLDPPGTPQIRALLHAVSALAKISRVWGRYCDDRRIARSGVARDTGKNGR